ncbi:tetratricopeptide repeat-containing response regulator [Sedimenticola hydrogenitrophicus]|uniref:tetratricopeptide repeat-containing response regulator n=1 Tax=Sedimenticola hydrogenitrophicus TaxID=2967975 RepID=UPI0021A2D403|nr:tetratricopeptide repeat-containing response regulator [Sedimenticola hydrogenitrophicus]
MAPRIEQLSFLIVDDYADMRGVLRNMLQSFGVTDIDSVANGREAIAHIESKRYDVILCDYNLGDGRDGQQILEEVRARKLIGVSSIFVMITAENTLLMVMGAVEYEPDSYLTKPFTKDLLAQRLERLLNKKSDLREIEQAVDRRDYEQANELLDQRIAENPRNLNEFIKLKADLALKAGAYDQAEAIYSGVLAQREIAWARMGIGKAYYGNRRYAEAAQVFQSLIDGNERFMAAYDWLARTRQALDEPEAAQKVLEAATAHSAKAVVRQRALGELALRNRDEKVAERAFSQAIRLGRHSIYKHPSIYANLARAKAVTSSGEAAMMVLRDLKKAYKGDKEAGLYAAMTEAVIQEDMDNGERARKCMIEAHELYKELGTQAAPELALDMARTCNRMGETERASELLHQAVKNNHSDELFLKEVGATMGDLGLAEDPHAMIAGIKKQIVRLNNRGVELAKLGKLDQAMLLFEEAVTGMPGNKVVNLNAARIFMLHMSDTGIEPELIAKVRDYLERVRQMDAEDRTLHKMQRMLNQLLQK